MIHPAQSETSKVDARSSQMGELFATIKSFAFFIAIAFLLRASVVEPFKIPSSSMEPTLEIGDYILVNKLSYGIRIPFLSTPVYRYGAPTRGDVVVFTLPDDPTTTEVDEADTNVIKRIIGLPGDLLEVRGTEVYINGKIYEEDHRYSRWLQGGSKDFGPVKVPEDHVLMLGDNRDYSRDSRFWEPSPFLAMERVKGRAFLIYWNSLFSFKRMFNPIR